MSGGGGSSVRAQPTTTTTTTTSEPWAQQKPFLVDVFENAQNNYDNSNLSFFPGQTFAPFSPETQAALGAQTNRAITGSPVMNTAQQELQSTLSGDYLDAGNPHFSQMADRIRGEVLPGIDARFGASNRAGSGLHGRAVGQGLGDAIGALAYQNYGDERTNQMRGMLFAPQMANQDYFDIAKLAEVGGIREDQTQAQINQDIARHDFEQMEPWQRLGLYNAMIQGNYGGSGSGTSTGQQFFPTSSLGAGMLGTGLSGLGAGLQAIGLLSGFGFF